ncbi:Hypothetical protein R9X50_00330800 [Acrodontium crateriforme]|uniref:Uncharacterized protein n=1 Tax=Acrodontium crateriforme TaxID=150365 RepID=A0AAQ3R7B5_9PEZI|nr:Hypothetical protein R9X50_00330800 [Acrodontium crateriforme]
MAPTTGSSAMRRFIRSNFTSAPIYPLKGIYYLATHRFLRPLVKSRLVPLTLLSTAVLALLFLTIYIPVVAFLAIFHYKGSAWVNGTFFILGIGTLVISLLFEAMFVDHTQVDIFDAVMIAEGYEHLVTSRRVVTDDIDQSDPVKRLGTREKGAQFAPFSVRQIIEFVVFLPLTFIPFAGVPLFLLITGYRAGPLLNWRYFALKGFNKKDRNDFIKTKKRRWEYMWFGTVYMCLQLVPILSMFFLLTSAVGSALWSVHMERENITTRDEGPYNDEDGDDQPPPYADEV